MMRTLRRVLILAGCLLVGWVGAGCDSVNVAPGSDVEVALDGPTWQLAGFEAPDGTTTGPGAERITVNFASRGDVEGQSPTNSFGGNYAVEAPRTLSVDSLHTTLAGAPDGSRYFDVYSALRAAQAYRIEEGTLRIRYGDEGAALLFEDAEAQP